MTLPRRILAGCTWFITRRTTRRSHLLRPDEDGTSQAIYWYSTAVLAKKFGIEIHAVQVLSTHIHEVLTDHLGRLPDFIRERNRAIANAMKVHRGWAEEVFQRAPASYVELVGEAAILQEIGYTISNCVAAGLVDAPDSWPGPRTLATDIGSTTLEVDRPNVYFDPNNPVWPARASLPVTVPPLLRERFGANVREKICLFVKGAIAEARRLAQAAGRRPFGSVRKLMRVPFQKQAKTNEPRRGRIPHFATAREHAITILALQQRRSFLFAYRSALERWRTGAGEPGFPPGTWRWCRELLRMASAGSMSVGTRNGSLGFERPKLFA